MVTCPHCGEENPERARFCLACGRELGEQWPRGEERKVVSVLFVDLVGFTSRSDRADPEDVRATLGPYHERVKADVERFGGTVEKFIGDAVMAVFGAPVAHEDDAERAVRSALRILETIEELRGEGLELAVRAAVTTGETVVALGARPERGEGIVTGDVVNVAARLQSAAPIGGILVDETTLRASEAAITFEPLEPVDAKGKAEPIPVWRVLGARSRVGQPEAATHTPFVGREHESTLLLETFLRSERESSVQLVTIVGEPGIGKSRLVTELRTTLDDRQDLVTWRHGRCLPYGEGITFWALGEIVKAEAGILESDDPDLVAEKLEAMLTGLVDDASERAWFFARIAPLAGLSDETAAASREEGATAWRRFLEALAAQRPCVIVLEDLHWADEALLEFVEHLVDWASPVPLLLLCTARPELFERRPTWGGGKRNATTISLAPLSIEESGRLLQLLLDRTLLPAETQAALLERAGGNPLYAEQFARMLAERSDAVQSIAVPETVQALLAARLDTLRPEQKTLLHDAAVLGRIFWSGAVAAIGGRDAGAVRGELNELVHREFVRPIRVSSIDGEDEFAFWHALTRDVAYGQIPRVPRAEKHMAAARWVERMAGERLEDHAGILVHHYEEAIELAQAAGLEQPDVAKRLWQALILAGDRAAQLDVAAAERYFRRAVELSGDGGAERAAALAKLAATLSLRGDAAGAMKAFGEAIPVLRETDEIAAGEALRRLSSTAWALGETERSAAAASQAVAILLKHPGPELVRAYGTAALNAAIAGRYEEAQELFEAGFERAAELGVENVGTLLHARASVRGYQGDARCVDDMRAAVDLARRLGLGRDTAVSMNNLADSEAWYVGLHEARETWNQAIQFSRERGITAGVMWQRGERLRCLYHAGEWDDALEEATEVLEWDLETSAGPLEVYARLPMAAIAIHRGDIREAQGQAAALVAGARRSGDPQVLVPGLSMAALVASAAGDVDDAVVRLEELEAITRDHPAFRSFCRVEPVRIALAVARPDLAELFVDSARFPSGWDACAHATADAMLAEARGDLEAAAGSYRQAAASWDRYGSVVEQAYALLGLGRCGDAEAEREAEEIFTRLGARPVLARAA